ncbi:MAG: hypothetical protein Q9197_003362 [Variospora fuerteventurae]
MDASGKGAAEASDGLKARAAPWIRNKRTKRVYRRQMRLMKVYDRDNLVLDVSG